jgi:hypothetical protein
LSSWVTPNIAEEFWGLGLADLLAAVANGCVPACVDGGFEFARLVHSSLNNRKLPPALRPRTYNTIDCTHHLENSRPEAVVTPAERDALNDVAANESDMGPPPDEDPNDNRIADWREGRRRAGATRRPPPR